MTQRCELTGLTVPECSCVACTAMLIVVHGTLRSDEAGPTAPTVRSDLAPSAPVR